MVNKRSWLRIVEAFISIILILGALIIFLSKENKDNPKEYYIRDLLNNILSEISETEELRNLALEKKEADLKNKISYFFSGGYEFFIRICELNESYCMYQGAYPQKDVYVEDRIISGNLNLYNPVKVRIFLWEKD